MSFFLHSISIMDVSIEHNKSGRILSCNKKTPFKFFIHTWKFSRFQRKLTIEYNRLILIFLNRWKKLFNRHHWYRINKLKIFGAYQKHSIFIARWKRNLINLFMNEYVDNIVNESYFRALTKESIFICSCCHRRTIILYVK